MEEGYNSDQTERKKRVQKLKRGIITLIAFLIILPIALCFMLLFKVSLLEKSLKEMNEIVLLQSKLFQQQSDELSRLKESNLLKDIDNKKEISNATEDIIDYEEIENIKKVYLTFDDGPSIYTYDILDILDEYDVKATFFVLGKEDKYSQKIILEIVNRGHTLGMHSYTHKYSEIYASLEDFTDDFWKLYNYLFELTGISSFCYRFPGGSSNTVSSLPMTEFIGVLDELDVSYYDWNISSGDGDTKLLNADAIVKNSIQDLNKISHGMILLHDSADKKSTVEALPQIIESILEMENTVLLPITDKTKPVQHVQKK